jgi:hypothetical protein
MRWSELPDDDNEDNTSVVIQQQPDGEEDGFHTVVSRQHTPVNTFEPAIFVFSDALHWKHPNYRDVVFGFQQLRKTLKSNRQLYKYWHAYSPLLQRVYYSNPQSRNHIITTTATEEYCNNIVAFIPKHIMNRHLSQSYPKPKQPQRRVEQTREPSTPSSTNPFESLP